ncbi:MAG TPA: hypothetical protein VFH72_12485 [Candidatus Baltobacteraceae bacterium]|nr:hypothetical protein [Candidatus Baltobacteraceae bacterium]
MKKIIGLCIIALAASLAACSHGANNALPVSSNNGGANTTDALHQKMAKEAQRDVSSFVAPKHPGYVAGGGAVQSWPSGIQEQGQAPVPGGMFDIVNQYNTTANGQFVTVYAGSRNDTGEGILLVVRRSADLHTATAHTYVVADRAVRIQSATNGQLQLQTVGGANAESIPFRMPL